MYQPSPEALLFTDSLLKVHFTVLCELSKHIPNVKPIYSNPSTFVFANYPAGSPLIKI